MKGRLPRTVRWLIAWVVLLFLSACQSPAPAPVVERDQPPTRKILHHLVSRGETLYSIAWRYELDFKKLAAVNGLLPPYDIHPGQKLSLDTSGALHRARKKAPAGKTTVKTYPVDPGQAPEPAPPPRVNIPEPPPLPSGEWDWQWPVRGEVSREYDVSKVLKGISIYTDHRAPVLSAAPGVVVYAGEGLRGYGRLIIVKHSSEHLSAYAHNHSLLVEEHQTVKQGQKIAEVGEDTSNRHRLYFEIRKNGKPVDPLNLLPK